MKSAIDYTQQYDVFLSYRRAGGETMAILLRDRLNERGYRVFLDIEDLNPGKFNKDLLRVIDGCTDFVSILSPGSLDRCVKEGDWVRLEIAHALKNEKNVVPLILRGFEQPENLPDDISDLMNNSGVGVPSTEFLDAAIDRLCKRFLLSEPVKKPSAKLKPLAIIISAAAVIVAACVFVLPNVLKSKTDNNGEPYSEPGAYNETITSEKPGRDDPPLSEPDRPAVKAEPDEVTIADTEPPLTSLTIGGETYWSTETEVNLRGCKVTDLSPLTAMKNLKSLQVSSNFVWDLSPLSSLAELEEIYATSNGISDLTPLSALTNLRELDLGDNCIEDISPLQTLTELTTLTLEKNDITDISPLRPLENLKTLFLGGNSGITDYTPLKYLKNLDMLYLDGSSIDDITALITLTNLTYLDMSGTSLTDAQCKSLRDSLPNCTINGIPFYGTASSWY